jgi:squalene-associated FAD-dependent desaturase
VQIRLMPEKRTRRVAVIGGGWAGCAAAATLVEDGHDVAVFEAARSLGGRARGVELQGRLLDNGQHILLGAYTDSLRLIRLAGVDPQQSLLRLPLQLCYPPGAGMEFVTRRLPAPLHLLAALLQARGLTGEDRLALARFTTAARWMDWQLDVDCTVDALLERFDQTERLNALLWRPLCLAALNTPSHRASAKVFLAVLRDSLGARRAASDMLIPRVNLSGLFPDAIARMIEQKGGKVHRGVRVTDLSKDDTGAWRLETGSSEASEGFDDVIVATSATTASALLAAHVDTGVIDALEYESIATCYLQYAETVRLPRPFYALADDPSESRWGQFVFDRGQLDDAQAGLLAVVVSAASDAAEKGQAMLAGDIAHQLAQDFGRSDLLEPAWSKVVTDKRATFSCRPDLQRPENATGKAGLWLAGDYTVGDYPATLEGAVRSGMRTAALIGSP